MKKFAFISLGLPPSQSGQSMVVYHLLRETDPSAYCLVTLKNYHQYRIRGNCSETLRGPAYFAGPDYQIVRILVSLAAKLRSQTLLTFLLRSRIDMYKRIVQKEECSAVVGSTGDLLDPPAAFIASRELGIPFVLYAFDYYSRQWTDPFLRLFAESQEQEILAGAEGVVAPNECLAKEYAERYGRAATVIHNPFDRETYEKNLRIVPPARDPLEIAIVYTGMVYEAHYSAVRNLLAAITKLQIPGLKLHLYTSQSEIRLRENGILGPVVVHGHVPHTQIAGIQHQADILFLPLAFGSGYPDIIRTSAPGKMGEYLASGRPVLVHAPQDSFIAWYFSKYQCGNVAGNDDVDELAEAIRILLSNKQLCETLISNAAIRARLDFDVSSSREKFFGLLEHIS